MAWRTQGLAYGFSHQGQGERASELSPTAGPPAGAAEPLGCGKPAIGSPKRTAAGEERKHADGASLMVQGLRIRLPIQGTRVLIPDRRAKTPHAAKPVSLERMLRSNRSLRPGKPAHPSWRAPFRPATREEPGATKTQHSRR